jgi:hypothetical protein
MVLVGVKTAVGVGRIVGDAVVKVEVDVRTTGV